MEEIEVYMDDGEGSLDMNPNANKESDIKIFVNNGDGVEYYELVLDSPDEYKTVLDDNLTITVKIKAKTSDDYIYSNNFTVDYSSDWFNVIKEKELLHISVKANYLPTVKKDSIVLSNPVSGNTAEIVIIQPERVYNISFGEPTDDFEIDMENPSLAKVIFNPIEAEKKTIPIICEEGVEDFFVLNCTKFVYDEVFEDFVSQPYDDAFRLEHKIIDENSCLIIHSCGNVSNETYFNGYNSCYYSIVLCHANDKNKMLYINVQWGADEYQEGIYGYKFEIGNLIIDGVEEQSKSKSYDLDMNRHHIFIPISGYSYYGWKYEIQYVNIQTYDDSGEVIDNSSNNSDYLYLTKYSNGITLDIDKNYTEYDVQSADRQFFICITNLSKEKNKEIGVDSETILTFTQDGNVIQNSSTGREDVQPPEVEEERQKEYINIMCNDVEIADNGNVEVKFGDTTKLIITSGCYDRTDTFTINGNINYNILSDWLDVEKEYNGSTTNLYLKPSRKNLFVSDRKLKLTLTNIENTNLFRTIYIKQKSEISDDKKSTIIL